MRLFILFCLLFPCLAPSARAGTVPDWVSSFPKETSEYKFYVGRGTAENETEAFDAATRNVYEQALKMNFGVRMQMNAETYQTETEARLTERYVEESALVRFNDFEQTDQYSEKDGGKHTVWVLYRFSKAAIKEEKKRLASLPERSKKDLSVVGSSADAAKGTLEIETSPVDGANVYVDGERFGQTPLRLIGALKTGRHDLRLEHPLYDAVEESVIVIPGKTVKISKTLKRAFADIEISSRPEKAEVRLNGRRIGVTPIKAEIPVGERIKLSLRHPETEESIHYFVDGEKIGTTPVRDYSADPGSHSVAVEKEGFEYERRTVTAKGGEEKSETFDLILVKRTERISQKRLAITDGHRDFEEILPRPKAVRVRRNATADDAVAALLRWDYPLSFLRASVSRTNAINENTYRFFIRLSFDERAYKRAFVTRASEILTPFAEDGSERMLSETCAYEPRSGAIGCKTGETDGHDTIYIKAGKTNHGFLFDDAPYKTYRIYTRSDWKDKRLPNVSAYKVRLTIFDSKGRESYSEDLHFSVRRFTVKKDRNILFAPSFYVESFGGSGTQDLLLATDLEISAPVEEAIGKVSVEIMAD